MRLNRSSIVATVPVTNIEEARRFYSDKLQLDLCESNTERGELLYEAGGGTHILVYRRPTLPTSDSAALEFEVDSLEETMKSLRDKGIRFEESRKSDVRTKSGMATMDGGRTAWFKDPAGNILALSQSEMGSRVLSGQCSHIATG